MMDTLVKDVVDLIKNKYTEEMMCEKFDEEIFEWVDRDVMEEEGLDEFEYYTDYGHGEAEDAIIKELINEAKEELNIEITSPEYIMIFDEIKAFYDCLDYR